MHEDDSRHTSVREVRVALTVEDFEGAVALYGKALGLPVVKEWDEPHGRGVILAAGAATIEILDRPQAEFIDEGEAGERVSGPVRLALDVGDVEKTADSLRGRGAEVVNEPVMTPWGDFNQRLRAPDGMQLTLFRTDGSRDLTVKPYRSSFGDSLLVRPALELAELLRMREVGARELVEAALRRLQECEGRINAFSFVDAERVLAEAEGISPDDPRPFAGVPIAIKDSSPQEGLPTRLGSALFKDYVADHDGVSVKRLKEAGFVPVGRTTMSEFGILPTTEPRLTGPTRNPWDLSRTPGGSSGGSAAAVAAGVVPLALGGDGGGSLRIPAACCGLVGLKASRGRISAGPERGDDPLVTEGVLTRTVADTAALLDVLSGYEPGDATWAPPPTRPFREVARAGPGRLRVGLLLEPLVPAELDPVCARAAEDAGSLLEELGHHVEIFELEPLTEPTREAFDDVWAVLAAEGVAAGGNRLGRSPAASDVEPLTWALYEKGRALDALSYRRSVAEIQRAAREVVGATLAYDVLLTPALAERPVPIGTITGFERPDPLVALSRSDHFSPYTALWNMTGQPAISLPLFHGDDGLPLGVQLVGPPAGEEIVLSFAAQLEEARPWKQRLSPMTTGG